MINKFFFVSFSNAYVIGNTVTLTSQIFSVSISLFIYFFLSLFFHSTFSPDSAGILPELSRMHRLIEFS